jgi:hypothetical protein
MNTARPDFMRDCTLTVQSELGTTVTARLPVRGEATM